MVTDVQLETEPAPQQCENDDEAALWATFKANGSVAARERLFSRHASFARNIARRLHRQQSWGDIELADLHQLAFAGLLEAIDRFDPAQGVPFRAYATHRVSGSVRDGIVRMSEMREQISWHHRIRRERMESLADLNSGDLTSSEAMHKLAELAVGLALGFMLEGTGLLAPDETDENGVPVPAGTAYDSLAWKEIVTQLHVELVALPDRDQMILRQHYLNGVNFEQLVALLKISKGRVSQLHRAALHQLRRRMIERGHFRLER